MATFTLDSGDTVHSNATTKKSRPLEDYPPEILIHIFEQVDLLIINLRIRSNSNSEGSYILSTTQSCPESSVFLAT
jgi:hypothetical protein